MRYMSTSHGPPRCSLVVAVELGAATSGRPRLPSVRSFRFTLRSDDGKYVLDREYTRDNSTGDLPGRHCVTLRSDPYLADECERCVAELADGVFFISRSRHPFVRKVGWSMSLHG